MNLTQNRVPLKCNVITGHTLLFILRMVLLVDINVCELVCLAWNERKNALATLVPFLFWFGAGPSVC